MMSLKEIQKLRSDLFQDLITAKERLKTIYSENKTIPSVNELFTNELYENLFFDYQLDENKALIDIKKEIEDLTYLFLSEHCKNKAFLGNFSYSISYDNNSYLIHYVSDIFSNKCIELTNIVLCNTSSNNAPERPRNNIKVRFCVFRERKEK